MGSLAGKVAIVTGSTSGIGNAVARALAADGAAVVVNSTTSVEAGTAFARELPDAIYVRADVVDETQAKALVAAATERWGRLDILINNAGTTRVIPHADLDAVTDEVWRRILGVNLLGTWYMTRAAVPALRKSGGGSIVNITSIAGIWPSGSSVPYAVSKAALNHLTRLLAKALAPDIRVNAVAPGLIDTPWTRTKEWEEVRRRVLETAPLARLGTPDDVAQICLMLARSAYCTGEVVIVDGGLHLH